MDKKFFIPISIFLKERFKKLWGFKKYICISPITNIRIKCSGVNFDNYKKGSVSSYFDIILANFKKAKCNTILRGDIFYFIKVILDMKGVY